MIVQLGAGAGCLMRQSAAALAWLSYASPTWMGRSTGSVGIPMTTARKAQDQALLYRTYQTSCFAGLPDVLLDTGMPACQRARHVRTLSLFARGGAGVGNRHLLTGVATHATAAIRDWPGWRTDGVACHQG